MADFKDEKLVHAENSLVAAMKAKKNEVEVKSMRNAHVKDALALVSFIAWLEDQLLHHKASLNETQAANKLEWFRRQQEHFVSLSFPTISAAGPNSAVIHYEPHASTARQITLDQVYLLDSGGQYLDGTTDVTRTMHFGTPSEHEKQCFTRVLQGVIGLSRMVFPEGTSGPSLDVAARMALWRDGRDFHHGTGHGVGAYLNVHEGPFTISGLRAGTVRHSSLRAAALLTPLAPGMMTSNEPGWYEEGKFGIRIENVMVVVPANRTQFLAFDTLTLVPLQRKMMALELLQPDEVAWIDQYHAHIRSTLTPLFNSMKKNQSDMSEHATRSLAWLNDMTQPIKS